MIGQVLAMIVDEGKWLTASMGLALLMSGLLVARSRRKHIPERRLLLAAMNLFFAATIGTMAFGHLLAVTVKLLSNTLAGSRLAFYGIGLALALPSWALIGHTERILAGDDHERRTTVLTIWMVGTLLALGLHNLPLAASGFINLAYVATRQRTVGRVLAAVLVAVNVGLFAGSLVFLASGQTFEQFRGIE